MTRVAVQTAIRQITAPGRPRQTLSLAMIVGVSLLCASDMTSQAVNALQQRLNLFSLGPSITVEPDTAASASGSRSTLIQNGVENSIDILAFGQNQSAISQFGQGNEITVRQDGVGLVSVVEQGRIPGLASLFERQLDNRANAVDPLGGVSGNRAFIDQAGIDNRSVVGQFGLGGEAVVIQRGTSNLSSVFQSGDDASVFVSQTGERNSSLINQHDFAVRANLVQTGQDGLSEIRQWDQSSGSIAQVFQAGSRAMSDIDQAGVSNLATVVQWDQGERSASTVIQDGNEGAARIDQAGTELVSIVRQVSGVANGVDVFQAGSNQVSEILQAGVNNTALARQSGGNNRSIINQIGSDNVATVVQSTRSFLP